MSAEAKTNDDIRIKLRPQGRLPRGVLSFVLIPRQSGERAGQPMIAAANVGLPDAGEIALVTTPFDEGAVVVDRDDRGDIKSVEFLANKDLRDLPEFERSIRQEPNEDARAILLAAHATTQLGWMRLEGYIEAVTKHGPDAGRRVLEHFDNTLRELRDGAKSRPRWRTGSATNSPIASAGEC